MSQAGGAKSTPNDALQLTCSACSWSHAAELGRKVPIPVKVSSPLMSKVRLSLAAIDPTF
jgi:hypothetical protein